MIGRRGLLGLALLLQLSGQRLCWPKSRDNAFWCSISN